MSDPVRVLGTFVNDNRTATQDEALAALEQVRTLVEAMKDWTASTRPLTATRVRIATFKRVKAALVPFTNETEEEV